MLLLIKLLTRTLSVPNESLGYCRVRLFHHQGWRKEASLDGCEDLGFRRLTALLRMVCFEDMGAAPNLGRGNSVEDVPVKTHRATLPTSNRYECAESPMNQPVQVFRATSPCQPPNPLGCQKRHKSLVIRRQPAKNILEYAVLIHLREHLEAVYAVIARRQPRETGAKFGYLPPERDLPIPHL